jgi:arylsulfatase A-like enzyme
MKFAAVFFALLAFFCGQLSAAESNRLNILFCFADDWGRYAGAYAKVDGVPSPNDIIKTPNVDRVAREGVLFRNAFVPAPSCTPCRSALLSGRYWWNTGRGAILQGAVWDTNIPSFPLLLRDAGYHIGKSFKVWSPGMPADAPFGMQKFAYEKAGRDANNFSENVTKWVGEGMSVEAAREKILAQVRGNFDAFLADRKPGQPWLYWFGPTTTHRTWIKGSGKKLWGIEPDSLRARMPEFLPDVPEVREDVADYLGEAQAYDSYVGVLLKRLEEAGELERTMVVVSGDHGMPGVPGGKCNIYDFGTGVALVARVPGGKAGRVVDDFVNFVDLAPTFMEVGGVKPPPGVDGRSFLDVLKSEKSGQVDALRTWVVTGRERHVGSAREDNLPYPMRALRTKDFLYIRNFAPARWPMGAPYAVTAASAPSASELETNTRVAFPDMDASPTKAWLVEHRADATGRRYYDQAFAKRPAEELYDLRSDPGQTNNVAGQASFLVEKNDMARRLMKILNDTRDPRVIGDGRKFDQSPFTDPEAAGVGARGRNAQPNTTKRPAPTKP